MHASDVHVDQRDDPESESSDGEGWLGKFDADDEDPRAGHADVRDSIRLPACEVYTFTASTDCSLSISVRCSQIAGIGHQLWPATFLLTCVLEERQAQYPGYWQGKRVLELGSGCGLVGLLAAALGAHTLLTDLPSVLELLRSNAAANAGTIMRARGDVDVAELTWGQPHLPAGWEQPDVVLAADLVYHRNLYQPLLETLALFGSNTTILVANVRRWKHAEAQFFKPARRHFTVTDLTPSMRLQHAPVLCDMTGHSRLRLFEFKRLQA